MCNEKNLHIKIETFVPYVYTRRQPTTAVVWELTFVNEDRRWTFPSLKVGWLLLMFILTLFTHHHLPCFSRCSELWTAFLPSKSISIGRTLGKKRNNLSLNILHNCYWHGNRKRSEQTNKIQNKHDEKWNQMKRDFLQFTSTCAPFFHRPDDVASFSVPHSLYST